MKEEKEIKIEILENIEVKKIVSTLKKTYGIHFNIKKETQDIYFDTKNYKFFNLTHALRIRIDNLNKFSIAYKAFFNVPQRIKNPWFVFEKEINLKTCKKNEINNLLEIADLEHNFNNTPTPENIENYFEKIGLSRSIQINKKRLQHKEEDFTICIDEVEDLGIFIEIEAANHKLLNELLNQIPFEFEQTRKGYTNLYAMRVLKQPIPDFDSKFKENPNWNYLPGQKKIVEELIK